MSAETAIRGQIDRIAKIAEVAQYAYSGGTKFRTRVDAAADMVYENIMAGQPITNLDAKIAAGLVASLAEMRQWIINHQLYFANAPTAAAPGLGYSATPWASYLAAKGWGVPYAFAELYYSIMQSRIPAQHVFPPGTWSAAVDSDVIASKIHKFGSSQRITGSWVWSPYNEALPTTLKGAPVVVVSDAGSTASACDVTATCQDGIATKTVTVTANGGAFAADAQEIVGLQALSGGAAAGQKVVPVAATAQFTALDWVILAKADFSVVEIAQVASIVAATSLTMVSNLINAWLTSDLVIPLYTNAVIASVTAGTNDDILDVHARPHRIIAL